MLRFFLFSLILFSGLPILVAQVIQEDSLLRLLTQVKESQKKISIYRNLADLNFESPKETTYLKQLINEINQSKDEEAWMEAVANITVAYSNQHQKDLALLHAKMIEFPKTKDNIAMSCWRTYLDMVLFDAELMQKKPKEAIEQKIRNLASFKVKDAPNKYVQLKEAYFIASAFYSLQKVKEALPYATIAVDIAAALPLKEAFHLRMITGRLLEVINSYSAQSPEQTRMIEKKIVDIETFYSKYIRDDRPFYPIDRMRIIAYSSLLVNIKYITPAQIKYYLGEILRISHQSFRPKDRYYGYTSLESYYIAQKDYPQVLAYNDSLLKYAQLVGPHKIPDIYNLRAQIYEIMGRHKEAFQYLKKYHVGKDSLNASKSVEQLNELQVRYNLRELNYANTRLEIKNKHILLVFLSIVLSFVVGLCLYLYKNLQKEKRVKSKISHLKQKAEESEKMKTAFVNSICHEIRTPLNAIVGFSDILFDEGIDEETRKTFPKEIQRSTYQLTSLINSMLEVSALDISEDKLPCEPTDLYALCRNKMDLLEMTPKPGISYQLDISEKAPIVSTNERYLSLVLENVLYNAHKFTEKGSITLACSFDKQARVMHLSVTDTGCGIPRDKQKEVFKRFTKLNDFMPGNGLGLYLCRLIITRLSGTIGIDAGYAQGTRVLIELPI